MKLKISIDFDDLGQGEKEYVLTPVQESGVRTLVNFCGITKVTKLAQFFMSLWFWGLDEAVREMWAQFSNDYRDELGQKMAILNRDNWRTVYREDEND